MRICMLTSSHSIFDNRIYYKEILSLKKKYDEIYLVAPGDEDFVTEEGIIVKCFSKRNTWHDRFRPMREMTQIGLSIKADVYHGHEPDSFQVALRIKDKLGSKAIYDSHEYHPEAFSEHFKRGKKLFEKIIYYYEKRMAKKADYIITVNELLIKKFNKYNKNTALVPNYPVLKDEKITKEYGEKPTFIYVGGLREDRGILKILEAIECTKSDNKYVFVGRVEDDVFYEKMQEFIKKRLTGEDITFTGNIPHAKVFEFLKKADAGFVLLQPTNWRYMNAEPIKLFEYMISETAVIASDFPIMKKIIDGADCGYTIEPNDVKKIAEIIDKVSNDREKAKEMGRRGLEKVKTKYNWSIVEKELYRVYDSIII
jgi:glycosyltransferase involved in cell wall biosynthesis